MNSVWRRIAAVCAFLSAAGAGPAMAQINVGLRVEYASVLLYENMNVFVTIHNRTGETIVFNPDGGSNIDLRFLITRETAPDSRVPRSDSRPLVSAILAREGETHESMVDLAHAYGMGGEGRYTVAAEVEWRGRLYRSTEVMVDVVRGMELEVKDAALRGYEDMMRRYALRYWHRDRYEHLFLTVEEPDSGDNLGVYDLGCLVRVFRPALVVDPSGDVLVVHQSGPQRYTRTAFRSTRGGFYFVDQVYLREDGTAWEPKGSQSVLMAPPASDAKEGWWSRLWKRVTAKPEPSSRPRPSGKPN